MDDIEATLLLGRLVEDVYEDGWEYSILDKWSSGMPDPILEAFAKILITASEALSSRLAELTPNHELTKDD